MSLVIVPSPSPNHNPRPVGTAIDCVVLHATGSGDEHGDVAHCRNANVLKRVSYHVIVGRAGVVYDLVPLHRRAWHAGVSAFEGREDVNDFSIGLSFANRNDGIEPYTDEQYDVGAQLVAGWMQRYPRITIGRLTSHRAVALPPGRKTDPLGFDEERFKTAIILEHQRVGVTP